MEALDDLLTSGGLEGMMYSISLTIIAMMFGGIAENIGLLTVLLNVILKRVKTAGGIVTATVLSSIFSNATMPEQYISLVVPGRMFNQAYTEKICIPKRYRPRWKAAVRLPPRWCRGIPAVPLSATLWALKPSSTHPLRYSTG